MAGRMMMARLMLGMSLGAMATVAVAAAPAVAESRKAARKYDIPAQQLSSALIAFSRQSGTVVAAPAELTRNKRVRALRGNYTTDTALGQLLAGTGLTYRLSAAGGYVVEAGSASESAAGDDEDRPASVSDNSSITVTGTRIRGAQPSSPVATITRDDLKRRGQNTLGEAVRALPQNFAGGQNPEVGFTSTFGGVENQNNTGGSSLNLRGLGPGATLTLLNGARLPYDGTFQATDVSAIPAVAIERIEVLLDGASAVYGSDAVGGVANIVLRKDFDGAQLSARYGFATDGGGEQQEYSGTFGRTWDGGGFIATADYTKAGPVYAFQRDYLAAMPNAQSTLVPRSVQRGGLISGHHSIGAVTVAMDAFYSKRTQDLTYQSNFRFEDHRETEAWGLLPSISLDLGRWDFRLSGFIGANDTQTDQRGYITGTDTLGTQYMGCTCNSARSVTLEGEGPLFELPAGDLRLALGAGYRYNGLDITDPLDIGTGYEISASRSSKFLFGEASMPVIDSEMGIPLISRLTLNGALRYEDYSDFGDITTPKLGAILSPVDGIDFKASWGKSFKTPNLGDQYFPSLAVLFPTSLAPYGGVPAGNLLSFAGGSPTLTAERATSKTAGIVIQPAALPGFRAEVNWFDIDYRDRVTDPVGNAGLAVFLLPEYAQFAIINPTEAQQLAAFAASGLAPGDLFLNLTGLPYDPSTVTGLLLSLYTNAAVQKVTGFDAAVSYQFEVGGGTANLDAGGTWLDGSRRITPLAPEEDTIGNIYYPAKFKGRAGASWNGDGLLIAANLNHVSGVKNTFLPSRPSTGSFNTVDLVVSYTFDGGALEGFEFTVGATNLFDTAPPLYTTLSPLVPPYDPTNYSTMGRVINFTVVKNF